MKKVVSILCVLILLQGCEKVNLETKPAPESMAVIEAVNKELNEDYIILNSARHEDMLLVLFGAYNREDIAPSKIVIYNLKDETVVGSKDMGAYFDNVSIVTLNGGFYIDKDRIPTVYDYELKEILKLDSFNLDSGHSFLSEENSYTFSEDMSKVAYVKLSNQVLTVYDFNTEIETEYYKLSDENENISKFNNFFLCGTKIGFAGMAFEENDLGIQDSNVYGVIDMENKDISFSYKMPTMARYSQGSLLIYDMPQVKENDNGTGESILLDINSGDELVIKLLKSINSKDVDIVDANTIVSYSEIGKNRAELILYRADEVIKLEGVLPQDAFNIRTTKITDNKLFISYLTTDNGKTKAVAKMVDYSWK
ncbi:hypothetical protein H9L01_04980 [Erysipelothrix inopinata]|uniref:Uncharacterized protein n=1 Tax=Erysipelothrix inopinata TaxID=225084 RepID=A0A7G9S1I7_9FIRM|nr:hypothetical protein [Erysipelothrix inopinata]QNN61712.1 hypothetical protein H9L01_04980 [Erysipelothrix inopinata]